MVHFVLAWMLVLSSTFEQAGFHAVHYLLQNFYAGGGKWRTCDQASCATARGDWGVDAATYTLYLRWEQTHNPEFERRMSELLDAAPVYHGPCTKGPCSDWSDTPAWDAVASMREYDVLHDDQALQNAQTALRYVERSTAFQRGACPAIPFQHPPQDQSRVKTLESTANAVKADLLVYEATGDQAYLDDARNGYDNARRYYLDPQLPLYTVHVIDDGFTCSQVAHRFFASVNGDMIWNGMELWRLTGDRHYANEALLTAHAVDDDLSDGLGIFVNMQGDNDVVEPLVEAMLDLAQRQHLDFARRWILRNANAALASRAADGSFPRFFDGPTQDMTSIWEANGGLALQIAAARLAPHAQTQALPAFDATSDTATITSLPATITVDGSGIALVGTISPLCERGHIKVLIDGVETTDQTGLWQNKSMPHGSRVLFAWRWPQSGHHTIELEPGDAKAAMPNALSVSSVLMR
ncbi:MAG TPA: hypothetical protein VFN49_08475 [Candidatus Aquilonibacter sp.]|nr:hypothetical protein [Candidatus Aquilonibacter sp.]